MNGLGRLLSGVGTWSYTPSDVKLLIKSHGILCFGTRIAMAKQKGTHVRGCCEAGPWGWELWVPCGLLVRKGSG